MTPDDIWMYHTWVIGVNLHASPSRMHSILFIIAVIVRSFGNIIKNNNNNNNVEISRTITTTIENHANTGHVNNSALIWQKEASDKSDISHKRAKCVCHLHWCQWNIMMSYLTYLLVGWVFQHEIWPGRRAHYVNYENINNSNLDDMSLASFCQSRAELYQKGFQQISFKKLLWS